MSQAATSEDPVIVVGAGLSGLATAIGLAENGRKAVVLEADELVGGAAAYSGGQVWVGANHIGVKEGLGDDAAAVEAYVRGIAHHHPDLLDEMAMSRWLTTMVDAAKYWEEVGAVEWIVIPGLTDYHSEADGAFGVGRYLTNAPIDGSDLGDWQHRLRRSPHFPIGVSYQRISEVGRRTATLEQEDDGTDPLTFGTGVVAMFLRKAIAEDLIEILPGHRVTKLLQDDNGAVAGVVAETDGGTAEFNGPVVLATSSYDWNQEMVEDLLGIDAENFGSVAPKSLRGDGISLAQSVGGQIGRIPGTRVPMLPGWPADNEPGFTYGPEYALPGSIIVDKTGKRFCDDSYYISLIERALDPDEPHLPCYLIVDERHHRTYGLGTTPPGGEYDTDLVSSADTLEELGEKLGIDGAQLEKTVARFNEHADEGEDPDFGRGSVPFVRTYAGDPSHKPNALLASLSEGPFHGLRLHIVGTGIGSSGVRIDGDAHVVDADGAPIDGLFAVGSCAALLSSGSGYNSGFALGRGITLAYLAAHELAGSPIPTKGISAS
jgi:3-oxosteroid 1-dehydrogenase